MRAWWLGWLIVTAVAIMCHPLATTDAATPHYRAPVVSPFTWRMANWADLMA
jgi:hypothetical protein